MRLPYKPGNDSDKFKTSNLVCLARHGVPPLTYVELHSGEGKYGSHNGTALCVLLYAKGHGLSMHAFLHEIRGEARESLCRNVRGLPATVANDWRSTLDSHIDGADDKTLFCIDPCTSAEYRQRCDAGYDLVGAIGRMCKKESGIFAYVPATRAEKPLLEGIYARIKDSSLAGVDLMHDAGSRTDHNIIVAHNDVLGTVVANHFALAGRLKVGARSKRI